MQPETCNLITKFTRRDGIQYQVASIKTQDL